MKVKHLIEQLQEADPELLVVKSKDEEGNGFDEVDDISIDNNVFVEGEVHLHHLTPELEAQGYTEEDTWPHDNAVPCIVIW